MIFSKLKVTKLLIDKYCIHNLLCNIRKITGHMQASSRKFSQSGNVPRKGVVPRFSDLEIVALNMTSETVGINSDSLLFAKLQEYKLEFPNLISRNNTMTDVKSLPPSAIQFGKE